MIRVNLLRSPDATNLASYSADMGGTETSMASVTDQIGVVGKVIVILLPIILFYAIKAYNQWVITTEFENAKKKLTSVESELKALDPAVKEMERFQVEKKKLDAQLEVIKRLSKERLASVKSLDALQTIIPGRVWLSSIKIIENKVELAGFATDDLVVSDFMQALGASIFFENITLVSSEEWKGPTGVAKKFVIKCVLEKI